MKKRAILYLRVSTEEQMKGYSIRQQESELTEYCNKNNYEIVEIISEEGQSAKTFKRRSWLAFEEKLKRDIKDGMADVLLITKIDRFSRNYTETRRIVDFLKSKKIKLYSKAEGLFDYQNIATFFPNTIHAAQAEFENIIKATNVKKAMRQALEEGRWMWVAPIGYKNDTATKLIFPDPKKAPIVKACFEMMATGLYSAEEVRRKAKQEGLEISKSAFLNLLKNHVYEGKILRKAYEEGDIEIPAKIVQGVHEPIISEETFNSVQLVLNGKSKKYKGKTQKQELFLRGHLYCPICNNKMTGSAPRGNGGNYHYYHCQRKYGCKNSFSAKNANSEFVDYLKQFQPRKEILVLYQAILEEKFKENYNDIYTQKKIIEKQIDDIKNKKDHLNDRFINSEGILKDKDYRSMMDRLEQQESDLIMRHATLKTIPSAYQKYLQFGLSLMGNIDKYFDCVNTETKQRIIGSIFPEKLFFEENKYRTTKMNELFTLYCSLEKDLNKKLPNNKVRQFRVAPPSGLEPETP